MVSTYNRSVSSVAFPTANFVDRFVEINQRSSTLEQEFHVNYINALSGARDTRINNYSNLYLTNKNKLTDFIQLSSLSQTTEETLTTRLSFKIGNEDPKYLYIYSTNSLSATDEQRPLGIKKYTDIDGFVNNFFFELEIINNKYTRIKHNNGTRDYFLNYVPSTNIGVFYAYNSDVDDITTERNDVFRYIIEKDGYLQLFKNVNDNLNILTLSGNKVTFTQMQSGGLNRTAEQLIYIDYTLDSIAPTLNNSFINYKQGNLTNLKIEPTNSAFNKVGQYVFQTNYNTISASEMELNYFATDTYRSEFNFIKRGSNLQDNPGGVGNYDYRTYNTFYTGNEQERGSEKINLNYTFYDKDIFIKNGADTHFKAPSAIYPYERLNINDTAFTQNGSFAGPSPALSDKIYAKRSTTGVYQNGRFLCTWLSANSLGVDGLWVDRYYYPDKITKEQALSDTPRYAPSFSDDVDSNVLNIANSKIVRNKFFDKKSDLAIVPNLPMKYERVGINDIKDAVNSQSPLVSSFDNYFTSRVVRGETENKCVDYNSNELFYDGTIFSKLSVYEAINNSKSFTISFDAYLDPNKQYGFQLLGNNTNQGFGVFQDQTVTPFLHVVSGKILYIYNSDFALLNKVEFKTAIKDVYKRGAMEDYIIATSGNLYYKVDSQGNKVRLECNSRIVNYLGSNQNVDNIKYISSSGEVNKLNVNNLEAVTLTAAEFDVYKDQFPFYENIVDIDNVTYKLPGTKLRWENNNTIFYVVSNYVVKHDVRSQPEAFLKSSTPIADINILEDNLYVATENIIYQYNTSGVFQLSATFDTVAGDSAEFNPLSGGKVISIDFVNEYINGTQLQYPVYLVEDKESNLYLSKSNTVTTKLNVSREDNTANIPITNYNIINKLYDSTSLDFKLTLQNYLNKEDILNQTISFDTSDIDAGFYSFTYRFDSIQGNSSLYINGALHENITSPPGKYQIQDIFNDEVYIGSSGFQSGLDLSTYLKQPGYYYIKDLLLKNLTIFDKAVNTNTIYALYMQDKQIDDLVISLPYSQRNNKTQIERFFKLGRHNSSKNIDIVVKNLNITDEDVRSQIKTSILNDSKNILPAGIKVNDILFKDYS